MPRPMILVDMDYVLNVVLDKCQELGLPMTKDIIWEYDIQVHARLLSLDIYGDDGERKFINAS